MTLCPGLGMFIDLIAPQGVLLGRKPKELLVSSWSMASTHSPPEYNGTWCYSSQPSSPVLADDDTGKGMWELTQCLPLGSDEIEC